MTRYVIGAVAALTLMIAVPVGANAVASPAAPLPAIKHVFVLVLENQSAPATFDNPSPPPDQVYLDRTLPGMGARLTNYFATTHLSNANYTALISGQGPNLLNQADCPVFLDFLALGGTAAPGQATGIGCVYPPSVQTIGGQMSGAGLTWKDYAEDMGNQPLRDGGTTCGHPTLNTPDLTQVAIPGDGYATRHNPFVYFHSVIDDAASCAAHVVPLGTTTGTSGLAADLASAATTPNFSMIVPNLCNDGHDPLLSPSTLAGVSVPGVTACLSPPGAPGGISQASAFLSQWVPLITNSAAFKADGMLVVMFDEGSTSDTAACCGQTPGPNAPLLFSAGGGRTGAVVVSPFVKPGTVSATAYNHYSLLGSIEDLFGVGRLGMAQTVASTFGPDVYTGP